MFGDNSEGQLGIGIDFKSIVERPALISEINEEVIQISCGYRHTLALTDNGKVYGMGSNRRFEMGLGSSSYSNQPRFYSPIRITALEMYMITKV